MHPPDWGWYTLLNAGEDNVSIDDFEVVDGFGFTRYDLADAAHDLELAETPTSVEIRNGCFVTVDGSHPQRWATCTTLLLSQSPPPESAVVVIDAVTTQCDNNVRTRRHSLTLTDPEVSSVVNPRINCLPSVATPTTTPHFRLFVGNLSSVELFDPGLATPSFDMLDALDSLGIEAPVADLGVELGCVNRSGDVIEDFRRCYTVIFENAETLTVRERFVTECAAIAPSPTTSVAPPPTTQPEVAPPTTIAVPEAELPATGTSASLGLLSLGVLLVGVGFAVAARRPGTPAGGPRRQ